MRLLGMPPFLPSMMPANTSHLDSGLRACGEYWKAVLIRFSLYLKAHPLAPQDLHQLAATSISSEWSQKGNLRLSNALRGVAMLFPLD